MALDALLEKPLPICETATAEELDILVTEIYDINDPDTDRLARCISRCEPDQVSFAKLRHLRILGDHDKYYLERFEQNGISRGCYLNADATWLLLILPEQSDPNNYLSRCRDALESLSIRCTPVYTLDVSTMAGLKRLELEDNPMLKNVAGVSNLTVLEQLTITDCPRLRKLPGLEKLKNLSNVHQGGYANNRCSQGHSIHPVKNQKG